MDTSRTGNQLAVLHANGRMEAFDRLMAKAIAAGYTVERTHETTGLAAFPSFTLVKAAK